MSPTLLLATLLLSIGAGSGPMKFITIDLGAHSEIESSRTVVVRTASDWAKLWKDHAGGRKAPVVDFTRAMVIAVFAGSRPTSGYGVEISAIETGDGKIVVSYRERRPSADEIVTQMLTSPFHIVSTEAHAAQVIFQRLP